MRPTLTHRSIRTVYPSTWCNRNGTYIRVLLIDPVDLRSGLRMDDVDLYIERVIVLISTSVDSLDEQTESLRRLASSEGIELVSADGLHEALLDRISESNRRHP
jgi:hypothetical protein